VYGRNPVIEVLGDATLRVDKIVVATNAGGHSIDHAVRLAQRSGVRVEYAPPSRVKFLAGNGRQDQGIVADVVAPGMMPLARYLRDLGRDGSRLFLLDGVTNPGNVGMIIRSATAAGLSGVVLPRAGTPHVGPLVIKASAGIAFRAPLLNTATASGAASELRAAGFVRYGLSARARRSLFDAELAPRAVFVLGGESAGVRVTVDEELAIPMRHGVESLNVAAAASVVAFEVSRR
jgi:23S rRNA (guanosine2251-2'-O)-methyltransferase